MFLPPSMLKIVATLYDKLDVAQKLSRNEKLAYKDHRTLTRHQHAYTEMTPRLLEYIAPANRDEVKNYLSNAQRFFCTLNEAPFETELSEKEALIAYWRCIFGPMLATLLHTFRDEKYEANTIHFIGQLLTTWEPGKEPAERAKWAKKAIKKQYDFKTPSFTQLVNDIRGGNVQSRNVINKNLTKLKKELDQLSQKKGDKVVSKVAAAYHAVMIIRRLEEDGADEYLFHVKYYLLQLQTGSNKTGLLNLHEKVCSTLLQNLENSLFSWSGSPLIAELDNYLIAEVKPTYPGFFEPLFRSGTAAPWPAPNVLTEFLSISPMFASVFATPLHNALMDYYLMYFHIECGDLDKAYKYCEEVEKASDKVHLGQFESANLLHKIVLYWMREGKMLHNQFDSEIARLIMNLPDEFELIPMINPNFQEFFSSLNDNELMMFRLFRIFNHYHRKQVADPLKKLTEIINTVVDVCANNDGEVINLLPILKKKISKNVKRSKSVLPFTKRLSLTDSVYMVLDLYSFVKLPIFENLLTFNNDERCKKLVVEFDRN